MAYSNKVLDHYNNPRNVGSFPKDNPDVGTGVVGAPECGDVMKLQLKINPGGVIEDARFKTFGCGSAIVQELNLPPVKIHCSVLAEDAIKAAINDWKAKHGQQAEAAPTDKAARG